MAFVSDYWHALDREEERRLDVSAKDIGVSYLGSPDVLENLQAAVRAGASAVELGFTGAGKGSLSGNQTTPEMFGKDKREAMRQLSKINEVVVSTHATLGISGFSGLDPRANAFTPEAAETAMHEIKRTVDFAADVARGGPVVVHTDEFPREISEKYKQFEMYEGETKRAPVYLVNKRTGKIEFGLTKDTKIPRIVRDEKGRPVFDEEKGEYKVEMMDFGKFKEKEKIQDTKEAALKFYEGYMKEQLERASFDEKRWRSDSQRVEREYEYLKSSQKTILDVSKKNLPLAKFQAVSLLKGTHEIPHPESEEYLKFLENPLPYLDKAIKSSEHQLKYLEEGSSSGAERRAQLQQQIGEIQPLEDYGKEASAKNLARAGMYAYDTEKAMKLEKPLFIAPENLLPEKGYYGSHPSELKEMIIKSREEMAKRLIKERGMIESEAKEIAADHIKATFDVGHAYTWKKYFKQEEGENRENYEKRFNKWLLKQVDDLTKNKIIGHVHISDNFGYYDEHLTPGTGSVPLKDFIKKLKDAELTNPMIAEPGAQAQDLLYTAWTGALGNLVKSPIYRGEGWDAIENSYFESPPRSTYSIVGRYAPSEEYRGVEKGAPFWSGVGLE